MAAGEEESPVFRVGGISYLEIPTDNSGRAGEFYAAVFGWEADAARFADGTGHVIGHFVPDRTPSGESGPRPYVFVNSVSQTLKRALSHGGDAVRRPYVEGDLVVATFRDPFGNVIGVWQLAEAGPDKAS
jgi:predicted enzyme related to lactoylglutathione lyase